MRFLITSKMHVEAGSEEQAADLVEDVGDVAHFRV